MPTTEWLKKWEQVKEMTLSPEDLNTYFEQPEIAGKQYHDYFAALFAESYKTHPEFQRKDGDWLNWQIPGTE